MPLAGEAFDHWREGREGGGGAGYLEGLPLDLPRGRDRLGLDEEGARVDQLHALQRLTPGRVQVLSLSHLAHLGLSVAGQLQDGLRDGGGVRGRDLRRADDGEKRPTSQQEKKYWRTVSNMTV